MPAATFLLIDIDLESGSFSLRSDGVEVVSGPWSVGPAEQSSWIGRIRYQVGGTSILFTTLQGDQVAVQIPHPTGSTRVDGRPVVYLDQNHWSTIARAIHEPSRLSEDVRSAALRLAELAQARDIILPLSLGHVGETGQWSDDEGRYRLALTMLDLSNGWQLRDVLSLRRSELQQHLGTSLDCSQPTLRSAVTLEPGAYIDGRTEPMPTARDLNEELQNLATSVTEISVLFEVLLDSAPTQLDPVPGWADRLQRITHELAGEEFDSHRRRTSTFEAFREDLTHEVAVAARELGLPPDAWRGWLRGVDEARVATMPSLGLFRELLHEKLSDPGTLWEQNDLIDMMYLSCGCAYADHVVGERRLISDLERSLQRLGRPLNVHRRLADLLRALGL